MSEKENPSCANMKGENKDSNALSDSKLNVSADDLQDTLQEDLQSLTEPENDAVTHSKTFPEKGDESKECPKKAPLNEGNPSVLPGLSAGPSSCVQPDFETKESKECSKKVPPIEGETEQTEQTEQRGSAPSPDGACVRDEAEAEGVGESLATNRSAPDSDPYAGDDDGEKPELPPLLQLLKAVGTENCPYNDEWKTQGEVEGRVFFITQRCFHPAWDGPLLSEEMIRDGILEMGTNQYAYILHDQDEYGDGDDVPAELIGTPKPPHWHILIKTKSKTSIKLVARRFGVPPGYVQKKPTRAFAELAEYLTHEHPNQIAQGKALYSDEDVRANFDFRELITKMQEKRAKGEKEKSVDDVKIGIMQGDIHPNEVRETYPLMYADNRDKFLQLRDDYLTHAYAPRCTTTIYFHGEGGTGKTDVATAVAKSLFPDHEQPFYVVGSKKVGFQIYDGQPVIIFDDFRPRSIMECFDGREGLLRALDPNKDKSTRVILNKKYGAVNMISPIIMITGPLPHNEFFDQIMGEHSFYSGGQKVEMKAENRAQIYRRVRFYVDVRTYDYSLFENQGVAEHDREKLFEFTSHGRYVHAATMRYGDIEQVDNLEDQDALKVELAAAAGAPIAALIKAAQTPRPGTLTAEEVRAKYKIVGQSADDLARAEGYESYQAKVEAEQKAKVEAEQKVKAEAERKVEVDSALQEVKNRGLNYYVLDAAMDWCRGTESGDASRYLQVNNAAEVYVAPVHPAIRYDDFAPVELRWLREYPQQFKPYCEVTDPRILDHHQRLNRVLSYQEFVDEMQRFQSTYKVADSEMHHLYQRPFTRWYLGATVPSRSVAKATPPPADELARVLTMTQPQQEQSA